MHRKTMGTLVPAFLLILPLMGCQQSGDVQAGAGPTLAATSAPTTAVTPTPTGGLVFKGSWTFKDAEGYTGRIDAAVTGSTRWTSDVTNSKPGFTELRMQGATVTSSLTNTTSGRTLPRFFDGQFWAFYEKDSEACKVLEENVGGVNDQPDAVPYCGVPISRSWYLGKGDGIGAGQTIAGYRLETTDVTVKHVPEDKAKVFDQPTLIAYKISMTKIKSGGRVEATYTPPGCAIVPMYESTGPEWHLFAQNSPTLC